MIETLETYEKMSEETLKSVNRYSQGLRLQIKTLASALLYLDMANEDIRKLKKTFVVDGKKNSRRHSTHPAFTVAYNAISCIIRQMGTIGLTSGDLSGDSEGDRLAELTADLIKTGNKQVIIRPTAAKKAAPKRTAQGTKRKKEQGTGEPAND